MVPVTIGIDGYLQDTSTDDHLQDIDTADYQHR